ncbi:MAG: hypothetical protein ACLTJ8_07730 [Veillonella atypica]
MIPMYGGNTVDVKDTYSLLSVLVLTSASDIYVSGEIRRAKNGDTNIERYVPTN